MNELDLSLVSTNDLLTEVGNRCDHMGCIMMQVGIDGFDTNCYRRFFKGNSHQVIGLLSDLQSHILLTFQLQQRTPTEEVE